MARLGRSYPVQRIWTPHVKASTSAHPAYDATGAGSDTASNTSSISWSHTATAGAYALVFTVAASETVTGVTYGGTSMTELGSVTDPSGLPFYVYGLANVAAGAKTVAVTGSSSSGQLAGNSVSYTNVSSVGTPASTTGSGTSLSQSVTCSANQVIVQSFEAFFDDTVSSYSGGNGRSLMLYGGAAGQGSLTISDATSSTTFTASQVDPDPWAALSVVLS
jgi:hypothetical protein